MPSTDPTNRSGWKVSACIFAMVLAGLSLRAVLAVLAEHQLDCDESTVALMSLDILEQGARPMFFYGGSYNGGAAFEAYLGALVIALFGFSPVGFKLILALIWAAGALIFADLCRRHLPPAQAIAAVAFLCLGTPFFLEWSTTARGGFAETFFFSALLLWLAGAPDHWRLRNPAARSTAFAPSDSVASVAPSAPFASFASFASFGFAAGLSLWASEMILPLLPLAGAWLFFSVSSQYRLRALALGLCAFAIGLIPLAAYNAAHQWQHLRESALAALFATGSAPLSAAQLLASAHFVLGWGGWLLLAAAALAATRIALHRRPVTLSHVLLAHALLYGLGYWLSGLRFLELPPSRVLYPLQLNLAVLAASALDPQFRSALGTRWRALPAATLFLWVGLTAFALIQWGASGEPRARGSWRASWCLVDGEGLRDALGRRGVKVVFVNYWTATPLALANRVAARRDPGASPVVASNRLPENPRPGQSAAVALPEDSPLLARFEQSLRRQGTPYDRWRWGPYAILSGLDATHLRPGDLDLPALLEEGSKPPAPRPPDGFN